MKTSASIIFFFLFLNASILAKNDLDSLERLLETTDSYLLKDTVLTQLCLAYFQKNPNTAQKYAWRRLVLAEKMKNKLAAASSLGYLGNVYWYKGSIDSAIIYMDRSKNLYEELGNLAEVSNKLNNLGVMYSVENDYERAIAAYKKGIEIDKKIDNESGIANKIGNIAGIYFYAGDYETSLKYSKEAAELSSKIDDASSLAYHYANVGLAYQELDKYDSALIYLRIAVVLNDSLEQYSELGKNLTNIANTFSDTGRKDSAEAYFGKALELIERTESKPNAAFLFVNYAMFQSTVGEEEEAVELMRKGYFLARETGYFDLQGQAANSLAKSFENLDRPDSAYDYLRKYQDYLDSANSERTDKIRREFEVEYETEKKELENRLIRERLDREKAMNLALTLILIFCMSLIGLSIYLIIKLRNQNEKLAELNAAKDKFFSIIAHDLKNPLGAIRAMSESLLKDSAYYSDEDLKEFFELLHSSSNQVYELTDNLLNWARSQTGKIAFAPEPQNIRDICDNAAFLLEAHAREKKIDIIREYDDEGDLIAEIDANMILTVTRNLVSNAVKFTEPGGRVTIKAKDRGRDVRVSVSDTGVGFDKETERKIFRIDESHSTQGTAGESGSGLGLALCAEFVKKHGGEITAKGDPGVGAEFYFSLPKKPIGTN